MISVIEKPGHFRRCSWVPSSKKFIFTISQSTELPQIMIRQLKAQEFTKQRPLQVSQSVGLFSIDSKIKTNVEAKEQIAQDLKFDKKNLVSNNKKRKLILKEQDHEIPQISPQSQSQKSSFIYTSSPLLSPYKIPESPNQIPHLNLQKQIPQKQPSFFQQKSQHQNQQQKLQQNQQQQQQIQQQHQQQQQKQQLQQQQQQQQQSQQQQQQQQQLQLQQQEEKYQPQPQQQQQQQQQQQLQQQQRQQYQKCVQNDKEQVKQLKIEDQQNITTIQQQKQKQQKKQQKVSNQQQTLFEMLQPIQEMQSSEDGSHEMKNQRHKNFIKQLVRDEQEGEEEEVKIDCKDNINYQRECKNYTYQQYVQDRWKDQKLSEQKEEQKEFCDNQSKEYLSQFNIANSLISEDITIRKGKGHSSENINITPNNYININNNQINQIINYSQIQNVKHLPQADQQQEIRDKRSSSNSHSTAQTMKQQTSQFYEGDEVLYETYSLEKCFAKSNSYVFEARNRHNDSVTECLKQVRISEKDFTYEQFINECNILERTKAYPHENMIKYYGYFILKETYDNQLLIGNIVMERGKQDLRRYMQQRQNQNKKLQEESIASKGAEMSAKIQAQTEYFNQDYQLQSNKVNTNLNIVKNENFNGFKHEPIKIIEKIRYIQSYSK